MNRRSPPKHHAPPRCGAPPTTEPQTSAAKTDPRENRLAALDGAEDRRGCRFVVDRIGCAAWQRRRTRVVRRRSSKALNDHPRCAFFPAPTRRLVYEIACGAPAPHHLANRQQDPCGSGRESWAIDGCETLTSRPRFRRLPAFSAGVWFKRRARAPRHTLVSRVYEPSIAIFPSRPRKRRTPCRMEGGRYVTSCMNSRRRSASRCPEHSGRRTGVQRDKPGCRDARRLSVARHVNAATMALIG